MSTRHLEAFFQPRSIVVIGASEQALSLGGIVLRNLQYGGFEGALSALNLKRYDSVHGVPCYTNLARLPDTPDLAIICTPPETVPRLVRQLGRRGVRAALIVMGGLAGTLSRSGRPLTQSVIAAARPSGIRVLGPNSLGVLVPRQRLNASYGHMNVQPGELAYVGESAILGEAMLDWANGRSIGFSHFVTLGDNADVDIADVIDFVASDPDTRAILLHVERIRNARRFVSSVRAASRGKLVLALRSGRVPEAQLTPALPAPGVPNSDAIYDAVFHRAGVLRVNTMDELFDAVETLTRMQPLRGERLAILCNGFGLGALATDALLGRGGQLARFTPGTAAVLDQILPGFSRRDNPVDLTVVASPTLYTSVLDVVRRDPNVDAALVLHAPTQRASSLQFAQSTIEAVSGSHFNVLTSWMGDATVGDARSAFDRAGVPTYATPDHAVQAFMHMVHHRRNQEFLRETPAAVVDGHSQDLGKLLKLTRRVHRTGRDYLHPKDLNQLVAALGIPVHETHFARNTNEAVKLLDIAGPSMALRILHSEHCHAFRYGDRRSAPWRGIAYDLASPEEVRSTTARMQAWLAEEFPDSQPLGFAAQRMLRGRASLQISAGFTRDPVFGPLVLFGLGGQHVNVMTDRRIGLPPLNITLARDLIRGSHVMRLLEESTTHREERVQMLAQALVALSQMIVEVPALHALEINPLLLNREGLLAVNLFASLGDPEGGAPLAIAPYPQELVEQRRLPKSGRRVLLRPIRGEDEPAHQEFHQRLSAQSLRFRYFYNRKHFNHHELAQMTQIDYDREMAFVASDERAGAAETLGEVRAWRDVDNIRAEFSVIVRDDLRGEGLGSALLEKMMRYCRDAGTLEIVGTVLPDNEPMLSLATRLGFAAHYNAGNDVMEMRLLLNKPRQEWQRLRLEQPVA